MRTKPIANDRKSNEIYRNRCAPPYIKDCGRIFRETIYVSGNMFGRTHDCSQILHIFPHDFTASKSFFEHIHPFSY